MTNAATERPCAEAHNAGSPACGRARRPKTPLFTAMELCHTRYSQLDIARAWPVSSRGTQLLTSVFDPGAPKAPWAPAAVPSAVASAVTPSRDVAARLSSPSKRRTQIWDLHPSLHCSIIGTCLSSGELRRLLARLKVQGAETADDHDLHILGVLLAGRAKAGAKHLQKALDRRHQPSLNQFAKAKDTAAVAALWEEALGRGDIPGAYWALLTHPAATDAMVKDVFGKVHMLSHLVGAANRADIRRLRQLEEDNAALAAKLERQQLQLRDGFTSRDESIRRLSDMLARTVSQEAVRPALAATEDTRTLQDALAELDKRLAHETSRRERLEQRLASVAAALKDAERARRDAESELAAVRCELAGLESRLAPLQTEAAASSDGLDLHGLTVLYVGGRANQAPQLKGLVESTKGRFLHHDGGIEHSPNLLPGLVSRADIAVFPVDCVSHDAAAAVKRVCRQLGKRYIPLRTSSLACLLSGLSEMQPAPAPAAVS